MKKIESGSLAVMLDEETLGLRIEKDGVVWNTDPKKTPELIFAEGTYRFLDAEEISHEVYSFGVGCGIRSRYAGFAGTQYAFETIIWIEALDGVDSALRGGTASGKGAVADGNGVYKRAR